MLEKQVQLFKGWNIKNGAALSVTESFSLYQRHLQQPHQQRQQVLGRGCPGAWGGASMCAACLFLISTPLTLQGCVTREKRGNSRSSEMFKDVSCAKPRINTHPPPDGSWSFGAKNGNKCLLCY